MGKKINSFLTLPIGEHVAPYCLVLLKKKKKKKKKIKKLKKN